MAESNEQVIDRVNEAFATGDIDGFLTCCADDLTFTMVGEGSLRGKERIGDWMRGLSRSPRFLIEEVIHAGDRAIVAGFLAVDGDEEDALAFCDLYRLRDGRVIELRSYLVDWEEDEGFDDEPALGDDG